MNERTGTYQIYAVKNFFQNLLHLIPLYYTDTDDVSFSTLKDSPVSQKSDEQLL